MTKQENRAIMDKFPMRGTKTIRGAEVWLCLVEISRIFFFKEIKKYLTKRDKRDIMNKLFLRDRVMFEK